MKICIISGTDAAAVEFAAQKFADENNGTFTGGSLTQGLYCVDLDTGSTFTTTADWVTVSTVPYDQDVSEAAC
jgi:hypothetical protein